MFADIKKLLKNISRKRKAQFFVIVILTVFATLFEAFAIGSLIPFLQILTDTGTAQLENYEVKDSEFVSEMVYKTTIFCSAIFGASVLRFVLMYSQNKFSFGVGGDFARRMFANYLEGDYEAKAKLNSSDTIALMTIRVRDLVNMVVNPLVQLFSSLLLLLGIVSFLIYVNSTLSFFALTALGSVYLVVALTARKFLSKHSDIMVQNQNDVITTIQHGINNLRDIVITKCQAYFKNEFDQPEFRARNSTVSIIVLSQAPKYFVESLGILVLAVISVFFVVVLNQADNLIVSLGAFALGAQRMLPILQSAYWSFAQLKGGKAPLRDILDGLESSATASESQERQIAFCNTITFDRVAYEYSGSSRKILCDVSFSISRSSWFGIVGESGSGKSTLLDLVMGLYLPQSGKIEIDGIELKNTLRKSWWEKIAFVPQDVKLLNKSIAENIAFGVPKELIDYEKVKKAARDASISEFVDSLPLKLETQIGEGKNSVSGGQRQRIGIARALYKNAEIIVLDEATSALDDKTEQQFLKSLQKLDSNPTIILITHKRSLLKLCDTAIEVKSGRVGRVQ